VPKRKTTILVVDGDALHREEARRILRAEGYRVLDAADYRNAINVHQQHQGEVSLLLTAISLPGGNGYELAKALVEVEPGLKVLFVSGQAGAKISRFYSKLWGERHMLARPLGPTGLLDRVNQILESVAPFSAGASG
jgi:two-component system cell cycle sensor histidine kinase/response regulator CckA